MHTKKTGYILTSKELTNSDVTNMEHSWPRTFKNIR